MKDPDHRIDVRSGIDTDADGVPDTVVSNEGELLRLAADLDRDGLADLIVEIGPDATVHTAMLGPVGWTIDAAGSCDASVHSSD